MKSKGANENESRRIMCLMVGMASGLKILVSAVQSRPCPPLFSASCPSPIFLRGEFVTRFVTNSGTLRNIPAHIRAVDEENIQARKADSKVEHQGREQ